MKEKMKPIGRLKIKDFLAFKKLIADSGLTYTVGMMKIDTTTKIKVRNKIMRLFKRGAK